MICPKMHWYALIMSTGSASSQSTTRRSTRSRPACPRASSKIRARQCRPSIKAMVLIGAGRSFIAGADIRIRHPPPAAGHGRRAHQILDASAKAGGRGHPRLCLGGGLEIALAGHYRIAVPSAKIGLPEVLIGILPGSGGTQRLPRLIGPKAAMEMITSGRHVPAEEANRLGIIDELVPESGICVKPQSRWHAASPIPGRCRASATGRRVGRGQGRPGDLRGDAQIDRAARPQPEGALSLHRRGRGGLHHAVRGGSSASANCSTSSKFRRGAGTALCLLRRARGRQDCRTSRAKRRCARSRPRRSSGPARWAAALR